MATAITCRQCGRVARDDARFCDACGAAIVSAASAEYKQVTVLFADVVRSMGIAAAVGPERLREIMADLVAHCAAVVQRYGGTVDKFTGDGVMALFGAPVALEDHAFRACLAALEIQQEAQRLAEEVGRHDGLTLQLRIGLNSGEVIAGDIGSGLLGYTAVGEQVGLAQRMESVAPAGGVMLSASTARLVEHTVVLDEPQLACIKGSDDPVPTRRLIGVAAHQQARIRRGEAKLVGRTREMAALTGMLDRAAGGGVVGVVGPPGIGKSRLAAETVALAVSRGLPVFATVCESHAVEVPFYALGRLMRTVYGVDGLSDDATARELLRNRFRDVDAVDLALLDDALSIRDPAETVPDISPDARQRRLSALFTEAATSRVTPNVYVIEDAHWIDPVSEAVLDGLLPALAASSLVLITYRPEYQGALAGSPGSQTIALAPLDDEQSIALITDLLGRDSTVDGLAGQIAQRAAGNPFFALEIVRDLVDRGVLAGGRGCYICPGDTEEVAVPATLQAAISARVDRLEAGAKHTLNTAAVIGDHFDGTLLSRIADADHLPRLIGAELVDQVATTPRAEYAFRHPMIRSVVYHSQLKSARAELHRCVAAAIQPCDENAALIAEHLEVAGELTQAFDWHMRAGNWARFRDSGAARRSWQRAGRVADRLPADDPRRPAMRIAPRALISGTSFRSGVPMTGTGFDELRTLAAEADDRRSLAIGMAGQVGALGVHGRYRESARLADELVELINSIDDPELTLALLHNPLAAKFMVGEMTDVVQLAQRVIDLAEGDPHRGGIITESPLLIAMMLHAIARACLGQPGWRRDVDRTLALLREVKPAARAVLLVYAYSGSGTYGAVRPDATTVQDTAEALQLAEQLGDDFTVNAARCIRGFVLVATGVDQEHGYQLLAAARDAVVKARFSMPALVPIDVELAKRQLRNGDVDGGIELLRNLFCEQFDTGEWLGRGVAAAELVEQLVIRGADGDLAEAQSVIERLVSVAVEPGFVMFEVMALRLRALLARARGDTAAYRELVGRYGTRARACDLEGHIVWAEEMAAAV